MVTPAGAVGLGEISETRPVPPEQRVPKTVALPPSEYSAPRTVTLEGNDTPIAPAPTHATAPLRRSPSMAVVLGLSGLVFLFTATIGFAIVWLAMS